MIKKNKLGMVANEDMGRKPGIKDKVKLGMAGFLIIIMCSGILLPPSIGHAVSKLDNKEELQAIMGELIAEQLEEENIAGATLSIVKDGEVLMAEGYGYADMEDEIPVDGERTLFRIGSVSKLITWTAVMQLVEQGKVDLDTDINKYIDFEIPARLYKDGGAAPGPITMKDLLTHTPGFEDVGESLFVLSVEEMKPLDEYLKEYLPARVYPPGEVIAYSNYGTALAGYIVEQVSGQPFYEYVEANIFEPLGMLHSTFRQPLPEELEPQMGGAYNYVDGEYHKGSFEYIPGYPAGSMSTTALDMAHFMLAHLQEGRYGERKILQEETAREMHRQQFTHHPKVSGFTYGFIEDEVNGEKLITHSGGTMLFFSNLYLMPEHDLGFFVSYNGGDVMQSMYLFQDFMDRYYPKTHAEPPKPPADARERASDYLGEYHPTRISVTSPDRFIGLLQALFIDMDDAGYLVGDFLGESMKFVEVEPGVYQNIETEGMQLVNNLAFDTDPEGRTLLASGAATYSKAPWYGKLIFLGVLLALSILLVVGTLGGWTIFFLRRLARRENREIARGAKIARGLAVAFSLLTLTYLLGILIIFSDIDPAYGVPNIIFGIVPPGLNFIFALPWVLAPLTFFLAVFTGLAWKNRYWTIGARIHYSLFTASALGLLWVLTYTNMI